MPPAAGSTLTPHTARGLPSRRRPGCHRSSGPATGSLCLWGLGTQNTDSCQSYSVTAGAYTEVQIVYDIPADDVGTLRVQI